MTRHLRKRRALSSIVASLILVAIVAAVGSVILFRGLGEVNTFSFDLRNYDKTKIDALREDLVFENVHFVPDSDEMQISISNIGTVATTISTISVVKIDTQEMIVPWINVSEIIQIDNSKTISVSADLPISSGIWNNTYYDSSSYKISVTTSKGNFFTTVANPYNT